MKSSKWFVALLWIPALLLAGCSGASLAVNLPAQAAEMAQVAQVAALETDSSVEGLATLQETFEQIYDQVNPSVVNIQVAESGASGLGFDEALTGLGSGFVWDREGHIVTNAHVVEGASEISVTFSDGSIVDAELVGTDTYSDLAVIRVDVDAGRLQPVELADSSQVRVGQIAIAIGNPFGLQGTMTQGIISGLSRSLSVDLDNPFSQGAGRYSIPDIIQTDASINPGNSGGVLVDDQGRVIGVTSAIATTSQSNSGVGFVIPARIVSRFVPDLIENGEVEHAWMGISGRTLTPDLAEAAGLPEDQQGVMVLAVTPESPAERAGLRGGEQEASVESQSLPAGGDVITAIDGQQVQRFEDMVSYLYNQTDPGQTVSLTVLRQGEQQTVELTLGVLPDQS
jgi:2-alkenal reductase